MLQHLGALMITSQLIGQVTESLIPYIMYRSRVTKVAKEGKKIVMKTADLSDDIERQGTQEKYLVSHFTHIDLNILFPLGHCARKKPRAKADKNQEMILNPMPCFCMVIFSSCPRFFHSLITN